MKVNIMLKRICTYGIQTNFTTDETKNEEQKFELFFHLNLNEQSTCSSSVFLYSCTVLI